MKSVDRSESSNDVTSESGVTNDKRTRGNSTILMLVESGHFFRLNMNKVISKAHKS